MEQASSLSKFNNFLTSKMPVPQSSCLLPCCLRFQPALVFANASTVARTLQAAGASDDPAR